MDAPVKTYWPNGIGVEIDKPLTATELDWVHVDRLGSPVAITGQDGVIKEKLEYDAWGKRRNTDGTNATPDSLDGVVDNRGFTNHEMLDNIDLVNMNGRIYDPLTAKFLSGDPFIQDPMNGQNYNRYSYVLNNPTNMTDPTGFATCDVRPGGEKYCPNNDPTYREPDNSTDKASKAKEGEKGGADSRKQTNDEKSQKSGQSVGEMIDFKAESSAAKGDALGTYGYAFLGTAWKYFGSEGVSQIATHGSSAEDGSYFAAALEVGTLGRGKLVGKALEEIGAKKLGEFSVGAYNELRKGAEAGLDAHHVGQKALMKEFIPTYNPETAPAILVSKIGHTINGPEGIVSRSMKGIDSVRDLVARDIKELRRVYSDVSNKALQELIELNKQMYPTAFKK